LKTHLLVREIDSFVESIERDKAFFETLDIINKYVPKIWEFLHLTASEHGNEASQGSTELRSLFSSLGSYLSGKTRSEFYAALNRVDRTVKSMLQRLDDEHLLLEFQRSVGRFRDAFDKFTDTRVMRDAVDVYYTAGDLHLQLQTVLRTLKAVKSALATDYLAEGESVIVVELTTEATADNIANVLRAFADLYQFLADSMDLPEQPSELRVHRIEEGTAHYELLGYSAILAAIGTALQFWYKQWWRRNTVEGQLKVAREETEDIDAMRKIFRKGKSSSAEDADRNADLALEHISEKIAIITANTRGAVVNGETYVRSDIEPENNMRRRLTNIRRATLPPPKSNDEDEA
jgi:hypothetical protein